MRALSSAAPQPRALRDALRYWEPRRVGYNLALIALAGVVVLRTWPHFRPAFALGSIAPLAVLALIANAFYCAVYAVEAIAHGLSPAGLWRHWRTALFVAGTLLAMFIEGYWILDEIYPAVPFVR